MTEPLGHEREAPNGSVLGGSVSVRWRSVRSVRTVGRVASHGLEEETLEKEPAELPVTLTTRRAVVRRPVRAIEDLPDVARADHC
ncbi:hypothetical protein BL254_14400 [Protofrankia sp. BMG5.30]|uniref:Uncharacterized protein n=1 Tax=Protofrankia coriariae TaxID=1562887 RepID=A0ABR5F349_9ACTN|nr:hypothetical protein FrCorBMG51_13410 [Protofrankia coriariae]ONH34797.1 hypothetical protein BL254_14400 [Protofrankia sp. BMG5.30]